MNSSPTRQASQKQRLSDEFILYLYKFAQAESTGDSQEQRGRRNDSRAALAALRRGLGRPPGVSLEMHRYVASWSQRGRSGWEADAHYLIASLFALHPKFTFENKNMGDHFAALSEESELEPSPSIERRFNSLLASPPEGLYRTLQQAIELLKAHEIAINWDQLFRHIKRWDDSESKNDVQRQWANAFWRAFAIRELKARKAESSESPP